jgi:hypothetical protein
MTWEVQHFGSNIARLGEHSSLCICEQFGFLGADGGDGAQPYIFLFAEAQPHPIIVYSCHLLIAAHHEGKAQLVGENDR